MCGLNLVNEITSDRSVALDEALVRSEILAQEAANLCEIKLDFGGIQVQYLWDQQENPDLRPERYGISCIGINIALLTKPWRSANRLEKILQRYGLLSFLTSRQGRPPHFGLLVHLTRWIFLYLKKKQKLEQLYCKIRDV